MSIMYKLARLLPPETAHNLGKKAMRRKWFAPGIFCPGETFKFFNTRVVNRLGLAAGFDKNGELIDVSHHYGFGWIEVGSVTYEGGCGNPKPRLFRIGDTLLNRMGLNGDPAYFVAERLKKARNDRHYGVNIAKTHNPDIIGDRGIRDIVETFKLLHGFGAYTAINISCPNTREGTTFQSDVGALRELMSAIQDARRCMGLAQRCNAIMIKLGPSMMALGPILEACLDRGASGFICCNTYPFEDAKYGKGGLSGDKVRERALMMIAEIRARYKAITLIGCGGVYNAANLRMYDEAGADFVQVLNGFVLGPQAGPDFAVKIQEEYYR